MATPLLASHDDQDRPSALWQGHQLHDNEQQHDGDGDEFARLLEKKVHPLVLWLPPNNEEENLGAAAATNSPHHDNHRRNGNQDNVMMIQRGPWVIIVAATCSVLHFGGIWASYMAAAWIQLAVQVQMGSSSSSSSTTHSYDWKSINLAHLLQDMSTARQYPVLLLLWCMSLMVPCLFMVLAPAWLVRDAAATTTTAGGGIHYAQRTTETAVRSQLEGLLMKWMLLTVFVVLLLSLAVNQATASWTGTTVLLQARMGPGWIAYSVGVSAALIALMVLRCPPAHENEPCATESSSPPNDNVVIMTPDRSAVTNAAATGSSTVSSGRRRRVPPPPPWAFRERARENEASSAALDASHPLLASKEEEEEAPVMTPLEDHFIVVAETAAATAEEPHAATDNQDQQATAQLPEQQQQQQHQQRQGTTNPCHHHWIWCRRCPSVARHFIVFQLGLLALVLWIPALLLPVVRWRYHGVVAHLDNDDDNDHHTSSSMQQVMTVGQLPVLLWTQGVRAGSPKWALVLEWLLLVSTVWVIPIVATLVAIGAWVRGRRHSSGVIMRRGGHDRKAGWYQSWLYCLHPAMANWVLAVALVVTIPALSSWSRVALLDGWCSDYFLGQDCWSVQAEYRPGLWLFLVQAVALELFVVLTLRWS